jgi:16S rRNA (cytidine1402-2'-O)-methyltransferase
LAATYCGQRERVSAGTLYLIPTLLGAGTVAGAVPPLVLERIRGLRYFIVEEPKSARAFLQAAEHPGPLATLRVDRLAAQPDAAALGRLLEPLLEGADAGVLSEAGAPAVADPGAALVRHAHAHGVRVVPLVGPSAIVLALMASGLEGQRFAFHGYLPVDEAALKTRLRALEAASRSERRAEIFIETPYRNDRLLRVITAACAPETLLSIAADLTLASETIATRTIAAWRMTPTTIGKRPAVFLLLA